LGEFLVILLLGFMGMKAWEVRFEGLPNMHENDEEKNGYCMDLQRIWLLV